MTTLNNNRFRIIMAVLSAYLVIAGPRSLVAQGVVAGAIPEVTAALGRADAAGANSTTRIPELSHRDNRYVVQRLDTLLISFPISPELNQTVTVQPDGYINLQNGHSIRAQGLSVPELRDAVKAVYLGILHNPIVDVDLKDFQKPFFTVNGQVGKPGQYDLRDDITIAEAIAVAGGLAPTAKTQVFLFHRSSKEWFEVEKINLKEIFKGRNLIEDTVVKPGDMIYVPETFISNFRKYVPYSVNAGTYLQPNPF